MTLSSSSARLPRCATPALVAGLRHVLPRPLLGVLLWEARTLRALWLAVRRQDDGVGQGDRAFGYAEGLAATMGALTALAVVELAVVHLAVPWQGLRTALLVLGVWTVVAVLGVWAGLRRYPHVVGPDALVLRAGPHVAVRVPRDSITRVRRESRHEPALVRVVDGTLHLPVHGSTSLLVELDRPVVAALSWGRTAPVTRVAFAADRPDAVVQALHSRQDRLRP